MSPEQYREAIRQLYGAAPEAAALIEHYVETLEKKVLLLQSEDAFRAFVLELARDSGATRALMERIERSILDKVAQAELDSATADKLRAEHKKVRFMTLAESMSQPWVLAAIGLLSLALAAILNLVFHFLGIPWAPPAGGM